MTSDSFSFGAFNSADDWGIYCVAWDVLLPPRRERRTVIPGRSGAYDFGPECYDMRTVRLDCVLTRRLSKAELREIAWALSQKSELRLWNEPDKYYFGGLSGGMQVTDFPDECMRTFELSFTCEPFACGPPRTLFLTDGPNRAEYRGTAPSPCTLVLKNPNDFPVSHIQISAIYRR